MNLQELLNALDRMGVIAILSEPDMEYAVSELCDSLPEDLSVASTDRIEFLERFAV